MRNGGGGFAAKYIWGDASKWYHQSVETPNP